MTASFYKTVYQRKFEELPRWKKLAIVVEYVTESGNKFKKTIKKKN